MLKAIRDFSLDAEIPRILVRIEENRSLGGDVDDAVLSLDAHAA